MLVDIWQANATGHYAGHPGPEPGRENEKPIAEGKLKGYRTPYPRSQPEETFLRGAWPTDEHGVAQFISGWQSTRFSVGKLTQLKLYSQAIIQAVPSTSTQRSLPSGKPFRKARSSRISWHTSASFSLTMRLPRKSSRYVPRAGAANGRVDEVQMYPYSMNPIQDTVGRTRNWEDALNIFQDSHSPEGEYNPIFKLELLGGIVRQGLIGYITMVGKSLVPLAVIDRVSGHQLERSAS